MKINLGWKHYLTLSFSLTLTLSACNAPIIGNSGNNVANVQVGNTDSQIDNKNAEKKNNGGSGPDIDVGCVPNVNVGKENDPTQTAGNIIGLSGNVVMFNDGAVTGVVDNFKNGVNIAGPNPLGTLASFPNVLFSNVAFGATDSTTSGYNIRFSRLLGSTIAYNNSALDAKLPGITGTGNTLLLKVYT